MARLNLNMSVREIVTVLAREGDTDGYNPGALSVLMQIVSLKDPGDILAALLMIDIHEIYGSKLWIVYKDRCGEDITRTLEYLRSLGKERFPEQGGQNG